MTPPGPTDARVSGPAPRPPTRWGDREQRRLDILDAARQLIRADGYLALNMRDLAAAAGVSPATLYSYFATKEELFATLYAEAIREHVDALRPGCEVEAGPAPVLEHVLRGHVELYRAYGRYFTLWSELRDDADPERSAFPAALVAELRQAVTDYGALVIGSVRAAAARAGRRLLDDDVARALLWSTLNGVADHLASERHTLDTFDGDQLVAFAAERLALVLTAPA